MELITQRKKELNKKYAAIYRDFVKLMEAGNMKMSVYDYLAKKYGYKQSNITKIVIGMRRKEERA